MSNAYTRWMVAGLAALGATSLVLIGPESGRADSGQPPPARAPDFTATAAADWINSAPLTFGDLRGKVVLLDIWTFDCWNCYRSIP